MKRKRASTDHTLMTMDPEFVKTVHRTIQQALEEYKIRGMAPGINSAWKCNNIVDFKYGFFVGSALCSMLSSFRVTYDREYTAEEKQEITELVEQHAKKIKKAFYKD